MKACWFQNLQFLFRSGWKLPQGKKWVFGSLQLIVDGSKSLNLKYDILVLFLHTSCGSLEFPNCGNLMGADCMENLRWAKTEPSMHFRETNTEPSMHFRKANTDPSMQFRKPNTEILVLVLLSTLLTISLQTLLQFLSQF